MDEIIASKNSYINENEKTKMIKSFSDSKSNRNVTEEEFQNFMQRVTQVEKIVKQLASTDINDQEQGMHLADEILGKDVENNISEDTEVKVKTNRTIINKCTAEDSDPNKMSQEAFKRYIEKDAQARAEDRKARNERAETYKTIGNAAFKQSNYEKAITYFTKALEQRKDSSVIWNNRALSYMKLGLFEKALLDCEWALKVNEANIKALLNSAKCYKLLGNDDKYQEFIALARERNPRFDNYISEFQRNLESESQSDFNNEETANLMD